MVLFKNSVLIAVSIILLAACNNSTARLQKSENNQSTNGLSTNKAYLPNFNIRNEQGEVLSIQSFKGKKILVNLWATWCPPCRAELPTLQTLYNNVDTSKVVFALLSLDKNFEQAIAFKQKNGFKMPIFYPAEKLPQLFDVQGIPTSFIFNENGYLIQQIEGGDDFYTLHYKRLFGAR